MPNDSLKGLRGLSTIVMLSVIKIFYSKSSWAGLVSKGKGKFGGHQFTTHCCTVANTNFDDRGEQMNHIVEEGITR